MRIVFLWEWTNTLDVIARFDEGIGEIFRMFAREGHEVWITTWGKPATGLDQGVNFQLFDPTRGYHPWINWVVETNPDMIFCWGSIDHKIAKYVKEALPKTPLYFFLAGGGVEHPNTMLYDHYFVETAFHVGDLAKYGKPSTKALGVMTDILTPIKQPKLWEVLLPASFTTNKRYSLFADVVEFGELAGVAVGPVNEEGALIECQKVNCPTFGYVSRKTLRDFYCASRITLLTGGVWGGSQRTLLESLACGTPVIACDDNFQLDWLIAEGAPITVVSPHIDFIIPAVRKLLKEPPDPQKLRQWVLEKFTAKHYYDTVIDVIESTVKGEKDVITT